MKLSEINLYVTKYSCKWIVNLIDDTITIDKTYINCILYLVGENKQLITSICEAVLMEGMQNRYSKNKNFVFEWENLKKLNGNTLSNNLVRLARKYPKCSQIINTEICQALIQSIEMYKTEPLKYCKLFNPVLMLYKFTEFEYEFVLLLYVMKNEKIIANFIDKLTNILRSDRELPSIFDVSFNMAKAAEETLIKEKLMSYKDGKLHLSHILDKETLLF